MTYTDLKDKSLFELYDTLTELKKEQFVLSFQHKNPQQPLQEVSRLRGTRRAIARILTRISELKKKEG